MMTKIFFSHGGEEYDEKYPEGIPTSVELKTTDGNIIESGLIMFPQGHALNDSTNLNNILSHKFELLG